MGNTATRIQIIAIQIRTLQVERTAIKHKRTDPIRVLETTQNTTVDLETTDVITPLEQETTIDQTLDTTGLETTIHKEDTIQETDQTTDRTLATIDLVTNRTTGQILDTTDQIQTVETIADLVRDLAIKNLRTTNAHTIITDPTTDRIRKVDLDLAEVSTDLLVAVEVLEEAEAEVEVAVAEAVVAVRDKLPKTK